MRGKNLLVVSLVFSMVLSVFMIGPVMSNATATSMFVDPASIAADLDTTFTVNVRIADVSQLFTWSFRLSWDPGILSPVSVTEGLFLKSQAGSTLFLKSIHAADGYMDVACTATGSFAGAAGSGILATVKFMAQDIGSTVLDLSLSLLVKPLEPGKPQETIPHSEGDGFVDVHSDLLLLPDFYVELVEKKVDDRHWDISIKGTMFTFYGKCKNQYSEPLHARILFQGTRDGEPFEVVTDEMLLDPGANSPPFQTFTMNLDPSVDIGEYMLQVYAQYSYRGFKWYTDTHKVKDLSFVIEE